MKLLALTSLLASAAAFTPAALQKQSSALSGMSMSDLPGSIDFMRKPFTFDPLNLSETYEPLLPYMRDAEIRNGRTAMLACVGMIVQDFVRLPGDAYSFETVPSNIDAPFQMPDQMLQIYLWVGLWEIVVAAPAIAAMKDGERDPGDYGMKAWLEKKGMAPEKVSYYVDSELLNGRLAMLGFMGMHSAAAANGSHFPFL